MHFKKTLQLSILALLVIALSACNLGATPEPTVDVEAIYTSAAETALFTFSQQLTQTALAASPTAQPTNTTAPTNTPFATLSLQSTPLGAGTPLATQVGFATPISTLSGPQCNDAVFIADVTVPDGSEMDKGQDFKKIWSIQNSGTCQWDEGYSFEWVTGDDLDGYTIKIDTKNGYNYHDFVDPGETTQFEILMTAPLTEREYTACWRMKSDGNYFFGTFACVTINVPD
jgi:hypothetical protein